ncbi:MAG: peptide MFS transporter [Bacteroidales bacterium]|nr:peptide MFS transporter [Bacteroidales bacterium]
MLKGHPKGLLVAFFANMGERFGYYTMLAIFVLYLQAKFGYTTAEAGQIYGGFLFGIYFLPLLGGIIADNWLGYGKTIILGTIVMFIGYVMLAVPDMGIGMVIGSLSVISLGTGFFKGNLQVLVGNMYDDPKYDANRDNAFNIFYMGINIGAFFAPSAAEGISNYILGKHHLAYDARIPHWAHEFLDGKLNDTTEYLAVATQQLGDKFTNLTDFSNNYIQVLSQSYNAGFAIAAISMVISLLIFVSFRKYYRSADLTEKQKSKSVEFKDQVIELTKAQVKQRLIALFLVFFVVIFFWMAFHQNGYTMTIFARDYTQHLVGKYTFILFDLKALLPILAAIIGLVLLLNKKVKSTGKIIGAALLVAGIGVAYWAVGTFNNQMPITPAKFQHFNPIFIVFLTPVIVGMFSMLRTKKKEPSSPKKIGFGMIITGLSYALMMYIAYSFAHGYSPKDLGASGGVVPNNMLASPYWLIGTYFSLTIAELFLSPMGISFVSKVSPPKMKGLMQGGWLGATALGNLGAGLVGYFWDKLEIWQFFAILVGVTLLSALFIFSVMKLLEKAAKS